MADTENLKKLKIAELRKELTDRGLSSKGNKSELLERLTAACDVDGADAVIDNDIDADAVLTAEDDGEDLLTHDEELDDEVGDDGTDDARKVEVELEPDEIEKIEPTEEKKVTITTVKPVTDDEKKALRGQKFGVSLSDADRKKARAERFGMPPTGTPDTSTQAKGIASTQAKGIAISVDTNKLKQRAERFGTSVSPTAVKAEEAERIRKRKERFGAVAAKDPKAKVSDGDDAEAKKRKRAERFGMA